jgi:hypothetical protein
VYKGFLLEILLEILVGYPVGLRDADRDATEEPRWIFHGLPENKVEKSTETFLYTIKMSYI